MEDLGKVRFYESGYNVKIVPLSLIIALSIFKRTLEQRLPKGRRQTHTEPHCRSQGLDVCVFWVGQVQLVL